MRGTVHNARKIVLHSITLHSAAVVYINLFQIQILVLKYTVECNIYQFKCETYISIQTYVSKFEIEFENVGSSVCVSAFRRQ